MCICFVTITCPVIPMFCIVSIQILLGHLVNIRVAQNSWERKVKTYQITIFSRQKPGLCNCSHWGTTWVKYPWMKFKINQHMVKLVTYKLLCSLVLLHHLWNQWENSIKPEQEQEYLLHASLASVNLCDFLFHWPAPLGNPLNILTQFVILCNVFRLLQFWPTANEAKIKTLY